MTQHAEKLAVQLVHFPTTSDFIMQNQAKDEKHKLNVATYETMLPIQNYRQYTVQNPICNSVP